MNSNNNEQFTGHLLGTIAKLLRSILFLIFTIVFLVGFMIYSNLNPDLLEKKPEKQTSPLVPPSSVPISANVSANDVYWHAPSEDKLAGNPKKEMILYGRDLVANTAHYFGPKGIVKANFTNGLNCQNCHLEAGTKVFGNNYAMVASTYPKYRARSGRIEDLPKRVNDCFDRSLNGAPLPADSKELNAIVEYIKWVGSEVNKGEKPQGAGLKELEFLNRAADPENGKIAYEEKCAVCHQKDGKGQMNAEQTAFVYPPLWGEKSYNTGAGLYRISNFARFIKYNMPLGVNHANASLTNEEAWDIAAYVNSQPHPRKDTRKDWPKIIEKPLDHPFGPYADGFSEEQHKYGPFKPIKDKLASLAK